MAKLMISAAVLLALAALLCAGPGDAGAARAAAPAIDSTAPMDPQSVYGTVTDAETGLLVKVAAGGPAGAGITCSVGLIDVDTSGESWVGGLPLSTTNGRYEIPFATITGRTAGMRNPPPANVAYAVKIGAYGYVDERSPLFTLGQPVRFNAKLRKWPVPAGTVLNPDGTPARRAEVFMLRPEWPMRIKNGSVEGTIPRQQAATTDRSGHFRFRLAAGLDRPNILHVIPLFRPGPSVISWQEPYKIFVIGDKGYALLPQKEFMKKDVRIMLTAWGRVTGRVMKGALPMDGATVSLYSTWQDDPDHPLAITPDYRVETTDANGAFTIDRVPAGRWAIGRLLYPGDARNGAPHVTCTAPVDVKAGKTTEVVVGGPGRTVSGRVEAPAELMNNPAILSMVMELKLALPDGRPTDMYKWTPVRQQVWMEKWYEETEPDLRRKASCYFGFVGKDGTFSVEGVPAGKYCMTCKILKRTGEYSYEVSTIDVPADAAQTGEPFNAGPCKIPPNGADHIAEFLSK